MATEVSPEVTWGCHADRPRWPPAQAGSKRSAIAGCTALIENRVSQKGNSRGLAGWYNAPALRQSDADKAGFLCPLGAYAVSASGDAGRQVLKGETLMDLLIVVIVLLFLFGGLGGGYYGYAHYGAGGGGGILLVVLVICVVLYLLRGRRV